MVNSHSYNYYASDSVGNQIYKAYHLNIGEFSDVYRYVNKFGDLVSSKEEAEIIETNIKSDGSPGLVYAELILDENNNPIPVQKSVEITGRISIINDGEWHIAAVDLDQLMDDLFVRETGIGSCYVDPYDPDEYIKYLRLDIINEASYIYGDFIEIAYVGISSDENYYDSFIY